MFSAYVYVYTAGSLAQSNVVGTSPGLQLSYPRAKHHIASFDVMRRFVGTTRLVGAAASRHIPPTPRSCDALSYVTAASSADVNTDVKPFTDIPEVTYKIPKVLGQAWDIVKYRDSNHLGLQSGYHRLGKIFRADVFGLISLVYIGDVDDVQRLHAYDGRTPQRMILPLWKDWREKSGFTDGILIR